MPKFGKGSLANLSTCHSDLKAVLKEAIKITDFTVLCGYRGKADQNKAFAEGVSKAKFPKSRHNTKPSEAVDCAPYPVSWSPKDEYRFHFMAGVILAVAVNLGKKIDWGGNWKSFKDLPHFELKKKAK